MDPDFCSNEIPKKYVSLLLSLNKSKLGRIKPSVMQCVLTTFFVCPWKNVFCFTHRSPWRFNNNVKYIQSLSGGA